MKVKYPLSFVALFVASVVTGCGMVSSAVTSDESLLDRAETSTGVAKENLTLVENSKDASLDAVRFSVKDKQGNLYKCYFTSAVAVTSDTICSKISK